MIEEAATQNGVVTAVGAKTIAKRQPRMNFEVGAVRSDLLGRARSHDSERGAVELPPQACGYAAGFGNVGALNYRGA
jgi:hypothetical protein